MSTQEFGRCSRDKLHSPFPLAGTSSQHHLVSPPLSSPAMGAETNGKPKGHHSPTMNGTPNGPGGTSRSSRARRKSRTTSSGWLFDKLLKLAVWYTILTLAFRCPKSSDELTESSPRICRPSLQVKEVVQPYVRPYYELYLDPYVQRAQPYVNQVNEKFYQPGLAAYQQYAAPRVADAQKYSQQQWKKSIKPQLDVARQEAGKQYDAALAPHVKKVQDVVQPYYDQVKMSASDIWELEIQPVYRNTAPYAQKIYDQGQEFAINTALPQAQYAGNTAWMFWARQIWPRIRVLYGENVEPQLHRITERLGRYKDGKRLEAEIKSMESEAKVSEASAKAETMASSISSTASEAAATPSSISVPSEPESTVTPTEQFREDLKSWEAICAKAVDEGADDLKERIQDIATHQTSSQARGVGDALVIQLEETAAGSINSVKGRIQSVVAAFPEDVDEKRVEEANEEIALGIRAAAQNVKGRAQAIRDWHVKYKNEMDSLITQALQSTLETIDSIRDLRLTEIGRRYADKHLPHKEWSKYNDLKKATQTWRDNVEKVSKDHPSVTVALEAGEEVENRGMSVAEETAKELGRLKGVAKWKIAAGDATDDFSTKVIPPAAEKAKQQVVEKVEDTIEDIKEAVLGSSQGIVESATSVVSEKTERAASTASSSAESAASKISEAVVGSEKPSAESAASEAVSSASGAASKVSEGVAGKEQAAPESVTSKIKSSASSAASVASEAVVGSESGLSDSFTDAASTVSNAIIGSETGLAEGISASLSSMVEDNAGGKSLGPKAASILSAGKAKKEAASKGVESAAEEAASSISSTSSDAASSASSAVNKAASSASSASKKVFAGANAQILVEAREPILDDIVDDEASYSERIQSMVDGVKDQAAYLTEVIEDALGMATSTQGTVESMTSVASDQYESAMSAASSVLFGNGDSFVVKGSEAARQQYLSAVTA